MENGNSGISALYPAARCRPGPGEESVIRADKAAVPGDKTRLLGHVIVPDHVGVQSLLIALHVVTHHDLGFPRSIKTYGECWSRVSCIVLYRSRRFAGSGSATAARVALFSSGICQPLSPATVLDLPSFRGKGAGIGVGIKVVWDPQADRRLVLLRAHPGIDHGCRRRVADPPSPRHWAKLACSDWAMVIRAVCSPHRG